MKFVLSGVHVQSAVIVIKQLLFYLSLLDINY